MKNKTNKQLVRVRQRSHQCNKRNHRLKKTEFFLLNRQKIWRTVLQEWWPSRNKRRQRTAHEIYLPICQWTIIKSQKVGHNSNSNSNSQYNNKQSSLMVINNLLFNKQLLSPPLSSKSPPRRDLPGMVQLKNVRKLSLSNPMCLLRMKQSRCPFSRRKKLLCRWKVA